MKRRMWWIVGAVTVVAAVGVSVGLWLGLRGDPSADQMPASLAAVQVERGDISQVLTVYGSVVANDEYTFTFDGDEMLEMNAAVGQRVEAGDVLVKLEDSQEELKLLQAERALMTAQAEGVPSTIAEKDLSYRIALADYEATTLRAPFAGVVTEISSPTTNNGNMSLVLIDTSELYIQVNVDQLDAPSLSSGLSATATIEPIPNRMWPVEVTEVGGMAITRGNSTVVVVSGKLLQVDPSILVGYTAELKIEVAGATDVLRVPISSLVQAGRGWSVVKVMEEETVSQAVTIGVTSNDYVEITSGLEEGDTILLDPSGNVSVAPVADDAREAMRQRMSGSEGGFTPGQGAFPGAGNIAP
ncbi:HlyD family efflux transporter periplasmic adaptor subunit [Candidatus Bipolaricaulota bacterium]|nr:HlyD family efflux transporter periplasmic adaptor subunit [Candidatus Bipolaricaulota bacterium]